MSPLRKGAFAFKGFHLHADEVDLVTLGDEFQTPCHVYSRSKSKNIHPYVATMISSKLYNRRQLEDNIKGYHRALGRLNHRIGFAIKAKKHFVT